MYPALLEIVSSGLPKCLLEINETDFSHSMQPELRPSSLKRWEFKVLWRNEHLMFRYFNVEQRMQKT